MAQRFSQNGWLAQPTTEHFTRFTAGGNGWWAANDDVAVVFGEFIRRFVAEVEPIAGPVLDDWSYANRLVRGSATVVSNHGSATACFAGDTEIVTRDGIRKIGDLAGTTATVLARDPRTGKAGTWVDAPIREFGVQPTRVVNLARHGRTMQIRATGDHRWYVMRPTEVDYLHKDGRMRHYTRDRVHEVTTDELIPTDAILMCRSRSEAKRAEPSPIGVAHGIVFGDGTLTRTVGSAVSLFGAKVELLRFFPEPRVTVRSRSDGLVETYVDNLPKAFKALPDKNESTQYLLGWLAGLIATDGHVTRGGSVMWSTASEDVATFVRDLCPRLGIGASVTVKKRGEDAYAPGYDHEMRFVKSTLGPNFMVRSDQRERMTDDVRASAAWRVESVTDSGVEETVYCATVPELRTFTLAGDLLTGNCDLNALQHPRGVHNTFTVAKRAAMRRIRNQITDASGRPVLRLGLDYTGTVDDMHVEVDTTAAGIKEAADKIRHQATLQEDDVSFADTHKLTEADVKAYGTADNKVGDRKSYDEILRFPPAIARLRREMAAQSASSKASIDALTKAVTALAAGSAKDVKAAFDTGIKGLEQAISDLDVKLVVTDTDND